MTTTAFQLKKEDANVTVFASPQVQLHCFCYSLVFYPFEISKSAYLLLFLCLCCCLENETKKDIEIL